VSENYKNRKKFLKQNQLIAESQLTNEGQAEVLKNML